METRFIEEVTIIDGEHVFQLREVLDDEEYMKWFRNGNAYFKAFIGEINECEAEMVINMNGEEPQIGLKNVPPELADKLRAAGLI